MPYIRQSRRKSLDPDIDALVKKVDTDGELNYIITTLLLKSRLSLLSYLDIERVMGLLECVKMEIYRRLAGPYEDSKSEESGDVFPGRS